MTKPSGLVFAQEVIHANTAIYSAAAPRGPGAPSTATWYANMKSDGLSPAVHSYLGFMEPSCVSGRIMWEWSSAELFSLLVFV